MVITVRNLIVGAVLIGLLAGCKSTLEKERIDFIERCMETHLFRGETYSVALPECEFSADRFIGKIDDRK